MCTNIVSISGPIDGSYKRKRLGRMYTIDRPYCLLNFCGTVQDQDEFIREQEQLLLQEQKDRLDTAAAESDQETREAAGRLEIKGVMLRAMSLEVDRFESIGFKRHWPYLSSHTACLFIRSRREILKSLRSDILCRVKFLQRSYHRSRVLKIQKYHQAILNDADEFDKLSLPVL
jgi:hypothetical protein